MRVVRKVVFRYVVAKSLSLLPTFKKAILDFERGDELPLLEVLGQVMEVILPEGGNTPPDWFWALGTAKRTALKSVYNEAKDWVGKLPKIKQDLADPTNPSSPFSKFPDPQAQANRMREYWVAELRGVEKKLRTLELATQATDEDREIKRGGFVVIPMPGVKKSEIEGALEALDEAASKIRGKFPQVLYGKVFFSTHLSAKTAAHYVYTDDTIHLSVRARKRFDDIYTLIHEFGHRFDHKFLDKGVRKELWDLSTQKVYEKVLYDAKLRETVAEEAVGIAKARKEGRPFLGMTPELERWAKIQDIRKPMTAFLKGEIDEPKLLSAVKGSKDVEVSTNTLLHEPLAVTPYGATNPKENIAEAFAHYVLGMAMPQEFTNIFARL